MNDILVSATPPASEITPSRILSLLSLLSHYFSFLKHNLCLNKGVVILSLVCNYNALI